MLSAGHIASIQTPGYKSRDLLVRALSRASSDCGTHFCDPFPMLSFGQPSLVFDPCRQRDEQR